MLIGRDDELARIAAGLAEARLVTLAGPGGVGKTALASAAARAWPTPVLFADLTALEETDLGEGVAGAAGFSSYEELLAETALRPQLIVLDNCEHVLDAAASVAVRLLEASDGIRVLATSRERLDLPSEVCLRIDPLPTDGPDSPAAELYRDAVRRRGVERADEPAAVDELCRRLDGLPLALELAAARAPSMTATATLQHLDPRLDLLARARPRGPERHRSLGAAVAWSYHQLDESVRTAFARLAAFPAPFTADMAAVVAGADVATLATLVERSLVLHESEQGESWYRMLETIRSYAAERLAASGVQADTEAAYLDEVGSLADRLVELGHAGDFSLPRLLGRLYRHLHRAIEQALAAADRAAALRLAAPLWWIEDVGHQSEAADLVERVLARWPDADSAIYGIAGALQRIAGRKRRSREAARIAAGGSGVGVAYGRRTLGLMARMAGRWDEAIEHFALGAAAARAAGCDGVAYELQLHAAMTEARAGDVDRAVANLEAAVAASDDYPLPKAWATHFLAYLLLARDPRRAAAIARGLIPVGRAAHDQWIVASSHLILGFVALADHSEETAAEHVATAIETFASIRNRSDLSLALLAAATVLVRRDDGAGAQATLATSLRYWDAALGGFEAALLDELGPLPEADPAQAPLAAEEVVQLLRAGTVAPRPEPGDAANRLVRHGDTWVVAFGGVEVHQRHTKGLGDLARLVAAPGKPIAALDLMGAAVAAGDAGPASDAVARRQYEERVRELQAEVDAAVAAGDDLGAERHREELDALVDHLSAAYGLGGRARPQGQPAEKARSAVTWRIRSTIKRIRDAHPALGDHLDRAVRTGRFCVYDPPEPVDWEV